MKKITVFLFITTFAIAIIYSATLSIIYIIVYLDGYHIVIEPNKIIAIAEIIMGIYVVISLIYLFYYFTKNVS